MADLEGLKNMKPQGILKGIGKNNNKFTERLIATIEKRAPCENKALTSTIYHGHEFWSGFYGAFADRTPDTVLRKPGGFYIAKDTPSGKGKLFARFESVKEYLDYLNKVPEKDRVFYETILGDRAQRMYFDLDGGESLDHQDDMEKLITALKLAIIQVIRDNNNMSIPEKNIIVCRSSQTKDMNTKKNKLSAHVIVNGYYVENNIHNKVICTEIIRRVKLDTADSIPPEWVNKTLDTSMWSSLQQLRMAKCQKVGSGRIKLIPEGYGYIDTLVSPDITDLGDSQLISVDVCKYVKQDEKNYNYDVDNNRDRPVSVEEFDIIVDKLSRYLGFDIYDRNSPIVLNRKKGFDGEIGALVRNKPSHCDLCDRKHEHENPFFTVSRKKDRTIKNLYYYCGRSGKNSANLGRVDLPEEPQGAEPGEHTENTDTFGSYIYKNMLRSFDIAVDAAENFKLFLCDFEAAKATFEELSKDDEDLFNKTMEKCFVSTMIKFDMDRDNEYYIWNDTTKLWVRKRENNFYSDALRITTKNWDLIRADLDNLLRSLVNNEYTHKTTKTVVDNIRAMCGQTKYIKGNVDMVKPLLKIAGLAGLFNSEPDTLPIADKKVINLRNCKVSDRTIENMFTFECPVRYIENMTEDQEKIPEGFFKKLLGADYGQDKLDKDKKTLDDIDSHERFKIEQKRQEALDTIPELVKMLGILLTNHSGWKNIFICIGRKYNGKSSLMTLLNTIYPKGCVGNLSKDALLESKNKTPNGHSEHLEPFKRSRVVVWNEPGDGYLDIPQCKIVSSGQDYLSSRGVGEKSEEYITKAKLIIPCNKMPRIRPDEAFLERLVIFYFPIIFTSNITEYRHSQMRDPSSILSEFKENIDEFFSYIVKYGASKAYKLSSEGKPIFGKTALMVDGDNEVLEEMRDRDEIQDFIDRHFKKVSTKEGLDTTTLKDELKAAADRDKEKAPDSFTPMNKKRMDDIIAWLKKNDWYSREYVKTADGKVSRINMYGVRVK